MELAISASSSPIHLVVARRGPFPSRHPLWFQPKTCFLQNGRSE